MPKHLVIVESPAKAKTIEKFLGKDYRVVASFGHIRDLPSSSDEIPAHVKKEPWGRMAVNVDNDYEPVYVVSADSKKQVSALKKELKDADDLILATDEDREGEAISWHLLEALKPKMPVSRIAFHEITKTAIQEALQSPREVDNSLVKAQESRRILDRLFGYCLSPVLWRKVKPKLSAGRVQSVALRLVVEREEDRRRFVKAGYWDLEAALEAKGITFNATLVEIDGKRIAAGKDFDADTGKLTSENVEWIRAEDAQILTDQMRAALPWKITRVDQKKAKLKPSAPFITSTLQQAASSILGFTPRKTMQVAQRLYEGIDLGGGEREGLITYMRTDSVVLSDRALGQANKVITEKFGAEYHQVRKFKNKAKNAQEAHEAIRPTELTRTPEAVASDLQKDELALYRLIWNRTLASQMAEAELLKTSVDITANTPKGAAVLRANGSVVTFPGFLKVADSSQKDNELPPVEEGQSVGEGQDISLKELNPAEHETKPPARFTEASLIRRLEEEGIGRPSTYAPTISTIQARDYVNKRGNALVPSILGIAVVHLLRKHFGDYIDLGFTARMEDALDNIANGTQDRSAFLDGFYRGKGDFGLGLEPQIETELPKIDFPNLFLGDDPETKEPIVVRVGKNRPFVQRGEGGTDNTATVPEEVSYDELTAELAHELIELKKKGADPIGQHPETKENIYVLIGPFGPYIQLGETKREDDKKPKRVGLLKDVDPTTVTVETALEYLSLPRHLGQHPESGNKVITAIGPYGPYVKCNKDFRSLQGEEFNVFNVNLDQAVHLLNQPKKSRRAQRKVLKELGKHPESEAPIELLEGRYGPYVTDGTTNASLSKSQDPDELTLDQALELIANAPAKKKKKAAKKKKKAPAKKKKAATKKKAPAKKKKAAAKKEDAEA